MGDFVDISLQQIRVERDASELSSHSVSVSLRLTMHLRGAASSPDNRL